MPRLRPWVTIYAIPLLVLVVLAAASPAFLGNDFEGLTISPPSDHGGQTAAGDDDYEDFVDYGTIPHLVSRIKVYPYAAFLFPYIPCPWMIEYSTPTLQVSNYSRGFRFDVLNSDPLVGFEFNIVSHPPNATIVASNGPLSVLAGFLLNYDVDIQKVVGWSPLEEAMEATTGQVIYRPAIPLRFL